MQPTVDGHIDPLEYANGIKISGIPFDSATGSYILPQPAHVQFTRQQCRHVDASLCRGGTLFIGLQLHSATREQGQERGHLDLLFDTRHALGEVERGCSRQGGVAWPDSDDRKFTISYESEAGQEGLTLALAQYQGNCRNGWRKTPASTKKGKVPRLIPWLSTSLSGFPDIRVMRRLLRILVARTARSCPFRCGNWLAVEAS